MGGFISLVGQRFGRLTVIERAPNGPSPKQHVQWLCRCDCANKVTVLAFNLRNGNTQSCGCLFLEQSRERMTIHGGTRSQEGMKTREYQSWTNAKSRCFNPKSTSYPDYGGRGITMCAAWRDDFAAFLAYMGPRPSGTTLDRFPNNAGNYEPGNVRWGTTRDQGLTKSTTIRFRTIDDEIVSLQDVARTVGMRGNELKRLLVRSGVLRVDDAQARS